MAASFDTSSSDEDIGKTHWRDQNVFTVQGFIWNIEYLYREITGDIPLKG